MKKIFLINSPLIQLRRVHCCCAPRYKYFNLNIIQQTWHRITVNISTHLCTFLSQKLFAIALIWFFVAEISWSKGKNNFEWSAAIPFSLSRSHAVTDSSTLVTRVLVSDERRQRFFFFFLTSTRRDVRISREKLGHRVFFRNGGRHSRFSSAFNVTFDLSYLASHLSYRLQTKCILKWKSFVVRKILNKYVHDISCQDWSNPT